MRRPKEADYTSHVAYARALEAYCDGLESCELLELAAKAAGIEYGWQHIFSDYERSTADKRDWNPLDDDGDAFRLAVKLALTINPYQRGVFVSRNENEPVICQAWNDEDNATITRFSIVRAAAEIGKAINENT